MLCHHNIRPDHPVVEVVEVVVHLCNCRNCFRLHLLSMLCSNLDKMVCRRCLGLDHRSLQKDRLYLGMDCHLPLHLRLCIQIHWFVRDSFHTVWSHFRKLHSKHPVVVKQFRHTLDNRFGKQTEVFQLPVLLRQTKVPLRLPYQLRNLL